VTFLRKAEVKLACRSSSMARASLLGGQPGFSAYLPARGPVFMTLIEKTFRPGSHHRTWDTVKKMTR